MRVLLVDFRFVNVEEIVELQRKPADQEQGNDEKQHFQYLEMNSTP